ncbi:hypothetical protein TSUD_49990 [Trifolium subterraneum]|uniref:Uncharacterized protein n=1 Tax=Trifolium subterraneum TaxID=3900 RepID=A0A2Z6MKB4_TRISU|nr:hypothetical protein TSUD_49990 [Trifolium subterraneum]
MDEVLEVLRRIDSGSVSGRDEFGHVEEVIDGGPRISCIDVRSLSPSSPDHVEVKLLKNKKLTPSPKVVTDSPEMKKWQSSSAFSGVTAADDHRFRVCVLT